MKEPKLRFKADDGSEFPEWEEKKLNEICHFGKDHGSGNGYIGTEDLLSNFSGVNFDLFRKGNGIKYKCGDTLMSNIRPYLKKTWHANCDGICSTDVLVFHPDEIESNFLYMIISSDKFVSYVMSAAKGSKMPRGDKKHMMQMLVGIPSIAEQKKIADFLSAVDARITEQETYVAGLQERKNGFLQQIFSRKLRFKTDDGNEFPGWEEKRLKEVASEFKSGKNIKADQIFNDGKYPVYGGNGLRGFTDHFNHDVEYALIGRQGALCGNMNYVSGKCYLTEHAVAVQGNEANDTKFLYYLLAVMNLGQYSGQSAQPGLAVNRIIELTNLFPSLPEQKKIADFFSALDEQIANEQAILDDWKLLKKGLLQQMFV